MSSIDFIATLESIIDDRLSNSTEASYTASLASNGVKRIAQKVGEEAVELALASVAGSRDEVLDEAADLVYHLLVLLRAQEINLGDVAAVLEDRHR